MLTNQLPVKVTQTYSADAQMVWDALTEIDQMREWFFAEILEYKAEIGFETTFDVQATTRIFPHHWKIIEVIQNKRLVTNWNYPGFDGDGNVIFDLSESKNTCTLTVTVEILKDFDQSIPEFQRESCEGGWTYFLKERLFEYLKRKG